MPNPTFEPLTHVPLDPHAFDGELHNAMVNNGLSPGNLADKPLRLIQVLQYSSFALNQQMEENTVIHDEGTPNAHARVEVATFLRLAIFMQELLAWTSCAFYDLQNDGQDARVRSMGSGDDRPIERQKWMNLFKELLSGKELTHEELAIFLPGLFLKAKGKRNPPIPPATNAAIQVLIETTDELDRVS